MLNYIWSLLVITSLVFSFTTGSIDKVCDVITSGAQRAVTLSLSLLGLMCFWSGIIEIAREGGLISFFESAISPLTNKLFPSVSEKSEAMRAITMNICANLLGMGNAATPLGIKAMHLLDEKNSFSESASDEMCMFVIINTASIQLIPTTMISLRSLAGSSAPQEICIPVWITSAAALFIGILSAKILERRRKI
ncbi:MAG: nucleoside recognition domain-containing protein [Clostridia bacterium]|nr:nucleoside recognition domain-containing protein [Clostridia bacterium]